MNKVPVSIQQAFDEQKIMRATSEPPLNRATSSSAGHELCTTEEICLEAGCRSLYPVGIRMNMPADMMMLIKSRSSIAVRGVDVEAGVVDADYKGIVRVLLVNNSAQTFRAPIGTSIAQGIVLRYCVLENSGVIKEDMFEHTGFGSTNA